MAIAAITGVILVGVAAAAVLAGSISISNPFEDTGAVDASATETTEVSEATTTTPDHDSFSLLVGDCIDDDELESYIAGDDFETILCDDPHDNEVYLVYEFGPGSYPGEDAVREDLVSVCEDEFEGYVGRAYESSSLDVYVTWPGSGPVGLRGAHRRVPVVRPRPGRLDWIGVPERMVTWCADRVRAAVCRTPERNCAVRRMATDVDQAHWPVVGIGEERDPGAEGLRHQRDVECVDRAAYESFGDDLASAEHPQSFWCLRGERTDRRRCGCRSEADVGTFGNREVGAGGEHHRWSVAPHPSPFDSLDIAGAPHDECTDAVDEGVEIEIFEWGTSRGSRLNHRPRPRTRQATRRGLQRRLSHSSGDPTPMMCRSDRLHVHRK